DARSTDSHHAGARVLGRQVDGARRCADRHRALYGDGKGRAGPDRRVQALRGAGLAGHHRRVALPLLRTVAAVVVTAACSACTLSPRASSESSSSDAKSTSTSSGFAVLDLTYAKPAVVGTPVGVTLSGLQPGKKVDLTWGTVTGGWVIEDYYHFRGKKYTET